ncbi:hypothetical protein B0T21DRAFT_281222, partial [Apiosordaria backusii]
TIDDLYTGFPEKFAKYLRYIYSLGFKDQPDYNYLQNLLLQVLKDTSEVNNNEFNWMKVKERRLRELGMQCFAAGATNSDGHDRETTP